MLGASPTPFPVSCLPRTLINRLGKIVSLRLPRRLLVALPRAGSIAKCEAVRIDWTDKETTKPGTKARSPVTPDKSSGRCRNSTGATAAAFDIGPNSGCSFSRLRCLIACRLQCGAFDSVASSRPGVYPTPFPARSLRLPVRGVWRRAMCVARNSRVNHYHQKFYDTTLGSFRKKPTRMFVLYAAPCLERTAMRLFGAFPVGIPQIVSAPRLLISLSSHATDHCPPLAGYPTSK